MTTVARTPEEASPRALTWTLVHAEPGALVFALPGVTPTTNPLVRRAAGWVPSGSPTERRSGASDEHPALHYAEYIGRVGVLAAALGVGAAVVGQPGIAIAEPTNTDTSPSVSASTEAEDSTEAESTTSAPETSEASATEETASATETPSTASSETSESSVTVSAPGGTGPEVTISSSGGAVTSATRAEQTAPDEATTEVTATDEEPPAEKAPAEEVLLAPSPIEEAPPTGVAEAPTAPTEEQPSATEEPAAAPEPAAETPAGTTQTGAERPSGHPTVAEPTPITAPTVRTAAGAAQPPTLQRVWITTPLAETPATATSLAAPNGLQAAPTAPAPESAVPAQPETRMAETMLAPLAIPTAAPAVQAAQTPLLFGLFSWVRRTFFNSTPTLSYDPTQTTQVDDTITGTLTPADADGPTPKLTVTDRPDHGELTVNDDGSFSYTVTDPDYIDNGGPDSFTVTATDQAAYPHIHGVSGFLHLITFGWLGDDGHDVTTTVNLDVAPVNAAPVVGDPTFTVTSVDPDTGAVTGQLNVTDPDDDDVDYTLVSGPDPLVGDLVFDAETGQFTLTPTPRARVAAYGTEGPDTAEFTVTANDGTHTTDPFTIAPEIDPTAAAMLTQFPSDYQNVMTRGLFFGPDGTGYEAFHHWTGTGWETSMLVISPTGEATTTDSVPGSPNVWAAPNTVVIGPDGTGYQVLYVTDANTTRVLVVSPDGETTVTEVVLTGTPNGPVVIGPNGTAYRTVSTGTETTVEVISPSGEATPHSVVGTPSGQLVVGVVTDPAGTTGAAYQTINTADGIRVLVITPSCETVLTDAVTGVPQDGVVVDPTGTTGTAYQIINTVDGIRAQVISPSGNATLTDPVVGNLAGSAPVVGSTGTAYQTVYRSGPTGPETTVLVVNPSGEATTTQPITGGPLGGVAVGSNDATGTAYQAIATGGGATRVMAVSPTGTITLTDPVTGNPVYGVVVGPDGTAALAIRSRDQFRLLVINPSGTTTVTNPVTGSLNAPPVVGSDGTAAQTVSSYGSTGLETSMVVISPTGTVTATGPVTGTQQGLVLGYNGTAAQTVVDGGQVRLVVVRSEGTVTTTAPAAGTPRGKPVIGPDGTAYQTITNYDTNQTTVLMVEPDGVATLRTLAGAVSGVSQLVVAPDGTAYQDVYRETATGWESVVLVIRSNGDITTSLPGTFPHGVVVGPDNSIYLNVYNMADHSYQTWLVGASLAADQGAAALSPLVDYGGGVVEGLLPATPVEGVMAFDIAGGPAEGTVTIDADGSFTYTPTTQARRDTAARAATPADVRDYFNVTVRDAHGGSATVPVWVAIDPATTPPARTLMLSGGDGNPVSASVTVTDPDTDPVVYLAVHDTAHGPVPMAESR